MLNLIIEQEPNGVIDKGLNVYWNTYETAVNGISVPEYLDKNEDRIRARYNAFIHDLGELKLKSGVNIKQHFQYRSGYNIWWMSLLVEKNLVKSPEISDCLKLFAFEEILIHFYPVKVRMFTKNYKLYKTVKALCFKMDVLFYGVSNKEHSGYGLNRVRKILPNMLKGLIFIGLNFAKHWPLSFVKSKTWQIGSDQLFIFSQFINLDLKDKNTSKVYSKYWETLPALLHEKEVRMNFLDNFYICQEVPNLRTGISWVNKINDASNDHGERHLFLYSFMNPIIVFKVFVRFIAIHMARPKLKGITAAFTPSGSKLNFWHLLEKDWAESTRGSVLADNLIMFALIDKVVRKLPEQKLGLYLQENNGWERAFVTAWRKYQKGPVMGVPHTTIRYWDLRYIEDERLFTNSRAVKMPRPDKVAVNGPVARKMFINSGYPASELVETEALRYLNMNEGSSKVNAVSGKIRILLCGDIDPDSTNAMLTCVEESLKALAGSDAPQFEIMYKSHPVSRVNLSKFNIPSLTETDENIKSIVHQCDVMIATDSTSAAVEGYEAGLKVIVFTYTQRVNFSPMKGVNNVSFVVRGEELSSVLSDKNLLEKRAETETFFWSDPALPRWRAIFKEAGFKHF
jgi:surface carbohydrate biosynthesis protein (TIGR04326 family)